MNVVRPAPFIEELVACGHKLAPEAKKCLSGIQLVSPGAGQKAQHKTKKQLFHNEQPFRPVGCHQFRQSTVLT